MGLNLLLKVGVTLLIGTLAGLLGYRRAKQSSALHLVFVFIAYFTAELALFAYWYLSVLGATTTTPNSGVMQFLMFWGPTFVRHGTAVELPVTVLGYIFGSILRHRRQASQEAFRSNQPPVERRSPK